jgi:D-serine deaminase-like pyridoxal phosphate-dependent protein
MKAPPEAHPPLPAALAALTGQGVAAIDTPAAVIDLDAMERNLARMAAFARAHGVRLRPHAKMHKSAFLARLQMQAGAVGVCVQKTSEAEALAAAGVTDIYISNQVIDAAKLQRVAALAQRLQAAGGRLAIAVDSLEGIARLAAAVESHTTSPAGRCSTSSSKSTSARAAAACRPARPPSRWRRRSPPSPCCASRACRPTTAAPSTNAAWTSGARPSPAPRSAVQDTRARIEAAGLAVPLVTGAGTGTFALETASGAWDELQAGSYLFMDADYAANAHDPAQPAFEHALFIKSQVISVNAAHAVCDAGHKSHAIDSGLPRVHALPGQGALSFANGGDEHGILHPVAGDGTLAGAPGTCAARMGRHRLAHPRPLRPDGQPARPPDRRARRAGARHGGAHHQG